MSVMEAVGRYRLIRRLGAGSFATVWLGHDSELDVDVAVKILAEDWADNTDVRERFVTEARLMRRIRDERITHVYDIGQLPDGRPYFVMDYADGGSLNELRRRRPSTVRALRLCAETCRALAALHEHDIVHRDVTPGNVLLTRDRAATTHVMIADLGVAKNLMPAGSDAAGALTAGTPAYMAPEQARGEHVDHRSDIYALAALCYAMLTGRPPFPARNLPDVVQRDPEAKPEPVAERLGAPATLDVLLLSGLSADPRRRPPTAALFGDALDRIADDLAERLGIVEHDGEDETDGPDPDDDEISAPSIDAGLATMIRPATLPGPPAGSVVTAQPTVDQRRVAAGGYPESSEIDAAEPDVPATDVPAIDVLVDADQAPHDSPAFPRPVPVYLLLAALGIAAFLALLVLVIGLLR